MSEWSDAVVIGGGIVGLSIALELGLRSLKVSLLESRSLGSGPTTTGFGWINATSKIDDETYHTLNARAVMHYDSLPAEFGVHASAIGVHNGGSLMWAAGDDHHRRERLAQRLERLHALRYPAVRLGRDEMAVLEPHVGFPEGAEGLFAPSDLWIDAPRLVQFLAMQARRRGVDIREESPVESLGRVRVGENWRVTTPDGELETPLLVIAAGMESASLVAQATGIASDVERYFIKREPGLLVETPPGTATGWVNRVLYPSEHGELHLRPTPDGGLLIGADDTDAELQNAPTGDLSHEMVQTLRKYREAGLLERVARILPGLPLAALKRSEASRVCLRPIPVDLRPIVGPITYAPGLHMAVMHSGVTLGPLVGKLFAEEVVSGRPSALLDSYRPSRFS